MPVGRIIRVREEDALRKPIFSYDCHQLMELAREERVRLEAPCPHKTAKSSARTTPMPTATCGTQEL